MKHKGIKKLLVLALGVVMAVGLTACGGASSDNSSAAKNDSQAAAQQVKKDGKTLVVYYSASGHTKDVAGYIAKATNGDVLELQPAQPYSDADLNYRDNNSRVVKEHDDESLRDVALAQETVDNWADYDTVFVGYPIWWGIAAWPVNNFVKHNDFTGKTVIPFATSVSSGLGESGTLLQKMAGTGNWLEGKRFSSNASESEVQSWVKSLGY